MATNKVYRGWCNISRNIMVKNNGKKYCKKTTKFSKKVLTLKIEYVTI